MSLWTWLFCWQCVVFIVLKYLVFCGIVLWRMWRHQQPVLHSHGVLFLLLSPIRKYILLVNRNAWCEGRCLLVLLHCFLSLLSRVPSIMPPFQCVPCTSSGVPSPVSDVPCPMSRVPSIMPPFPCVPCTSSGVPSPVSDVPCPVSPAPCTASSVPSVLYLMSRAPGGVPLSRVSSYCSLFYCLTHEPSPFPLNHFTFKLV